MRDSCLLFAVSSFWLTPGGPYIHPVTGHVHGERGIVERGHFKVEGILLRKNSTGSKEGLLQAVVEGVIGVSKLGGSRGG